MHLLIRAVSLAGQPLTQAISAYFDERGGTIGRADTNTLALPDPERRISRLQAEVMQGPEGYNIFNVGNANPIWQNDKAIGPGEGALLNEGDELQIGEYALLVSLSKNDETARTITKGRAAVDSRTVIVTSGLDPKTDPSLMVPIGVPTQVPGHFPVPGPSASVSVSAASPFADLLGGLAAPAVQPAAPSPFGSPASASSGSPFDVFAPTPAPRAPAPSAPAASAPATRLPDDFDPFADLMSPPAPKPASSQGLLPGDLDLMGGLSSSSSSSLDQMFGLGSAPQADPLADFLKKTAPSAAQAAVGAPSQVDPLAMLTPASKPVPADAFVHGSPPLSLIPDDPVTQGPTPDNTPEIMGTMPVPSLAAQLDKRLADSQVEPTEPAVKRSVEPKLEPVAPPPAPAIPDEPVSILLADLAPTTRAPVRVEPAPAPVPERVEVAIATPSAPVAVPQVMPPASPALPTAGGQVAPAGSDALWAAFCEGAGVSFVPPQGLNPDLMRVMGQLLRHAVGGTVRLVAARAATKQEMRAEVTVIQARRNNPLKFSPDAQSAMEQLLQPPLRGFMSGPEALDDAMDDLLGHTMGTMAGMRAALEGVLGRFEPEQLESKLVGRSMIDSLLPMNRRAKLWELYLQHYGAVKSEAQEDFHNLFGKAFLQAYEEQLDRLDDERRAAKAKGGQAQ